MTFPVFLRGRPFDPARALAMSGAWWVFWVVDLQAWQAWAGVAPSWLMLALSVAYGAAAVWWPRFIGGPTMLAGLSGACAQTVAINSVAAQDGISCAVAATLVCAAAGAACLARAEWPGMTRPAKVYGEVIIEAQCCALLTPVAAWAISGLIC